MFSFLICTVALNHKNMHGQIEPRTLVI